VAPGTEQLVWGTQPFVTHTCFCESQLDPVGQLPQFCSPSQPSPMTPQYCPPAKAHEHFVQLVLPQMPATLAPQAVPGGQVVPQFVAPPQPSPIVPQ
jgi:hypothetical protein